MSHALLAPLIVAVIGLLMFVLTKSDAKEIGRIAFAVGLLIALSRFVW